MTYKKKYIRLLEEFKDMEIKHFIEKNQTVEVLDLITDFIHENLEEPIIQKLFEEIDKYYDLCKNNILKNDKEVE